MQVHHLPLIDTSRLSLLFMTHNRIFKYSKSDVRDKFALSKGRVYQNMSKGISPWVMSCNRMGSWELVSSLSFSSAKMIERFLQNLQFSFGVMCWWTHWSNLKLRLLTLTLKPDFQQVFTCNQGTRRGVSLSITNKPGDFNLKQFQINDLQTLFGRHDVCCA